MQVTVFGSGAWGTALAIHLSRRGHLTTLVPRRMEAALSLTSERVNTEYLPGIELPRDLQIGFEPLSAIMEAEVVMLACPVKGLRPLCKELAQAVKHKNLSRLLFVSLCKGLETPSQLCPTEVLLQEIPNARVASLSGPTYAREVALGAPTAVTLAGDFACGLCQQLQNALSNTCLRVYLSRDLKGVELAGAMKNPYAIGAGLCDGLCLGDNARAAYLTRAHSEMVRMGVALGGSRDTFYGLSGYGDLVATAFGKWSRNRSFGEAVAKGGIPSELAASAHTAVEGYTTTRTLLARCTSHGLETPILSALEGVLYGGKSPREALLELMSRPLRSE